MTASSGRAAVYPPLPVQRHGSTWNQQADSGVDLPHIILTRQEGNGHRWMEAGRDAYTGVRAHYYDDNSAERRDAIIGTDDNIKTLRHVYTDEQSALEAARAEWQRLQRGASTLSYTLALGRPDLIPEMTYSLIGVKQEISATVWLAKSVTHSLGDSGYSTSLELENQLADDPDLAALVEGGYTGVVAWYRDEKIGRPGQEPRSLRVIRPTRSA